MANYLFGRRKEQVLGQARQKQKGVELSKPLCESFISPRPGAWQSTSFPLGWLQVRQELDWQIVRHIILEAI